MTTRSKEEVLIRCSQVWDHPNLINLVNITSSPTAAINLALNSTTKDKELIKIIHWFAILKRDYCEEWKHLMIENDYEIRSV